MEVLLDKEIEEDRQQKKAVRSDKFDLYAERHFGGPCFKDSEMCQKCIGEYREGYIRGEYEEDISEEERAVREETGTLPEVFFPVACTGDDRCGHGDVSRAVDADDAAYAGMINPDIWFSQELGIDLRWYQSDSAACTARLKVDRWGRRTGKTHHKVGKFLQRMMLGKGINPNTNKVIPENVLVLAPYQAQVDEIFRKIDDMLDGSKTLHAAVDRRKASPNQLLRLKNGSQAIGFCTGASQGSNSDKTRGQDATIIYGDEADYINDHDIESFIAILTSRPDVELWMTSTPSGKRSKFWSFCTDKTMSFKERHIPCTLSPSWNPNLERLMRKQYTQAGWDHEMMAIFGEVEGGVFPTKKLIQGLLDYRYEEKVRKPGCIYTIGVDWNAAKLGIPILVLEFDPDVGSYTLVDKYISNEEEFTQTRAVQDIIKMFHKWDADFIYADAGFGSVQHEMFKKYAIDSNEKDIIKKYKSVYMQGTTDIRDPQTKKKIPKQNKALMTDLAVMRVEAGLCYWPMHENKEGNLVDQLRNYEILRYTQRGIPVYSQGEEHQLVSWVLAMFAVTIEYSDLTKIDGRSPLGFIPLAHGSETLKEKEEDVSLGKLISLINKTGQVKESKLKERRAVSNSFSRSAPSMSATRRRGALGNRSF